MMTYLFQNSTNPEQVGMYICLLTFIVFVLGFIIGKKLEENIWVSKGKHIGANYAHGEFWYVITEKEYIEKILGFTKVGDEYV